MMLKTWSLQAKPGDLRDLPSHTSLGVIDLQTVEARVKTDTTTRKTYCKWKDEDRYKIGKYTSVHCRC